MTSARRTVREAAWRKLLLVLALLPALAWQSARAESPPLRMTGLVQHPQSWTLAQLKALPPLQVDVSFTTMHGPNHHRWTGVRLWDLVSQAGLRDEPGRRTGMRHVLLVTGADGYAAALAIGEIDPAVEGKQVIIAWRQDGEAADLPAPRLIVPADKAGARDVHDVAGIEIR